MNIIEKNSRIFLCISVVLVLVLVPVSQAIPPAFPVTSSSTGILLPLYSFPGYSPYPGANWQPVINSHNTYPKVPIIAIINPSSGPGHIKDANFVAGIKNLQSSGIKTIGYVPTNYTNRPYSQAKADVTTYSQNYSNINGILFDEMNNGGSAASVTYYQNLTNYAKSINNNFTYFVGNPGINTLAVYVPTENNLEVYENNHTLPTAANFSSWNAQYDKTLFSMGVFNVANSALNQTYVNNMTTHVGYLYFTDDGGSSDVHPNDNHNPWDNLATYFNSTLSMLNLPSILLTTQSVNLTGYPFTGQYTVINQSGNTIRTGYTQLVLNGTSGFQYVVKPQNYQQYVFDHWDGNGTDRKRTITPSKNTILTSYFKTPVNLTVKSVDLYGRTITGYYTVIKSSTGQTLATGYTPFTFTGSTGVTYTARVDNFNHVNFTHWDTGSTSDPRTITPVRDTTISAYYNNSTGLGAHSTYKINIQSKSLVGNPVTGLFVRIYNQGGSLNTTGYTPLTFTANNNKQYSVVSTLAYQQWHWNHWDGGSTNTNRTFTALVGQNLTEYYTVPTNIAVNTVDSGGNPLSTGLTFKIYNSTGLATQGIPSFTYTGSSNYTYTIQAGNSSSYKFSHWDYTASTNLNRTLTPMSNTIITAYYKN